MEDRLRQAEALEAQAAALEAEAAAIDATGLPDYCTLSCTECSYKAACDEVTQRIGKAYILRQRAANLLKG